MSVKPGDVWLAIKDCHSCGQVILIAPIPPEGQNRQGILNILNEAQPVKCPHCSDVSEYQLAEVLCFAAVQSH
jgi:hypothetical protein